MTFWREKLQDGNYYMSAAGSGQALGKRLGRAEGRLGPVGVPGGVIWYWIE